MATIADKDFDETSIFVLNENLSKSKIKSYMRLGRANFVV